MCRGIPQPWGGAQRQRPALQDTPHSRCWASWVAYGFLSRPVLERNDRLVVVFWHFVAGTLAFLPFLPTEAQHVELLDGLILVHVVFLGVGCSALAYWTYQVAIHRLGVAVANVFINLIPFITVLAALVVLGEALSPLKWVVRGGGGGRRFHDPQARESEGGRTARGTSSSIEGE